MKFGKTAKALALAVAVGMSSQVMAAETNTWWSFDFDGLDSTTTLTNEAYSGIGQWSTVAGDESSIATNPADSTVCLKLDTQGNNLTWTPTAASTSVVVLVDADIYLVGSDSAPTGFDDSGSPVQTAVYLKNYLNSENVTTSSVLCAYVEDGESANKWIELQGVSMVDTNWYSLRIEVDYSGTYPAAKFIVNGTVLEDASSESSFGIANYTDFSTTELKKVNSVSFRGTGAVDNFVGSQVVADTAAVLTFAVSTFTDLVASSNNIAAASSGYMVTAGETFYVSFKPFDTDSPSKSLSLVRVYTNGTMYVDYNASYADPVWTLDLPLFEDEGTEGIRLNIPTTGMTVGYTIEAYYGEAPTAATEKTVTFDNNGGSGTMTAQSASTATALTANTFTRTGYAFAGWSTLADGTGDDYVDQGNYAFTADATLYAQWTINQYTITFNSASGSAVSPITQDYNTAVTAPAAPTRLGYAFSGWNPTVPANMPAEDITLTAQWTLTEDMTFDTVGGANLVITSTSLAGSILTVGFGANGAVTEGSPATSTLWIIVSETLNGTVSYVEVEATVTSPGANSIEGTFTINTSVLPSTPDTLFVRGIRTTAPAN